METGTIGQTVDKGQLVSVIGQPCSSLQTKARAVGVTAASTEFNGRRTVSAVTLVPGRRAHVDRADAHDLAGAGRLALCGLVSAATQ